MTTELTNEQIEKLWPKAFGIVDFAHTVIAASIEAIEARHSEELLAYEATVANLEAQNDAAISVVSRLLRVHEDRSIEDATSLAYAMLTNQSDYWPDAAPPAPQQSKEDANAGICPHCGRAP